MNPLCLALSILFLSMGLTSIAAARPGARESFPGLPPAPVADLRSGEESALTARLAALAAEFQTVASDPHAADADIFLKAVRFALEFHEWYDRNPADGVKKANALLDEASRRIDALQHRQMPWMEGAGAKVLGFYSKLDHSPQPYAVEIPDGLNWGIGRPAVPLCLWLHGRGDTTTDLHFLDARLSGRPAGPFHPANAIVIHPFGRYCNGWKSAGEMDVLECRDDAIARFHGDPERVDLAGFSMGGAGAWHLGAHYADQWACVHTGAGFVDVRRYQKLGTDDLPPWYEQRLWGLYDVPDYARNFFNVPLMSYSGEIDAQRDAAEYMSQVLGREGFTLNHLLGPGMGHRYHPDALPRIQGFLEASAADGRHPFADKVTLQTRTARYGRMKWVAALELEETWTDARVDAEVLPSNRIRVETRNVHRLAVYPPPKTRTHDPIRLEVDRQTLEVSGLRTRPQFRTFREIGDTGPDLDLCIVTLERVEGKWTRVETGRQRPVHKDARFSGPIDEAFLREFVVVVPDGRSKFDRVQRWVDAESRHFLKRWRGLMRGEPQVRNAAEVTEDVWSRWQTNRITIVLWGDPSSNRLLRRIASQLPIQWTADGLRAGSATYDPARCLPVFACPLAPDGAVVVVNSGLTFREADDRTNSLQNPKLPDWAILDITDPSEDGRTPRIVGADFFDEDWRVRPPGIPPATSHPATSQ